MIWKGINNGNRKRTTSNCSDESPPLLESQKLNNDFSSIISEIINSSRSDNTVVNNDYSITNSLPKPVNRTIAIEEVVYQINISFTNCLTDIYR